MLILFQSLGMVLNQVLGENNNNDNNNNLYFMRVTQSNTRFDFSCTVYCVDIAAVLINAFFAHPWSPHLLNCAPSLGHPISMLVSYNTLT